MVFSAQKTLLEGIEYCSCIFNLAQQFIANKTTHFHELKLICLNVFTKKIHVLKESYFEILRIEKCSCTSIKNYMLLI